VGNIILKLNCKNGGLTQVMGWDITSLAPNAKYFGGASGLYKIDNSDTDNGTPITATVVTPVMDYGVKNSKRIRRGYLRLEADGDLTITCIAGEDRSFTGTVHSTMQKEKGKSFPGNRRYSGTDWHFVIENILGADFSIDYLGILFVPLTRHRSL